MVAPSGLRASPGRSPPGSNKVGTPADLKAIARMLFIEACLEALPALRWQESPWKPSGATGTPHVQTCADTTGHPTRNPTATLNSSSPRRSPREGDGKASSQQPELGPAAASKEALTAPPVLSRRVLNFALQTKSSNSLWPTGKGVGAIASPQPRNFSLRHHRIQRAQ